MDRHPRRHGQAVGSRVRPVLFLLPIACLAVALAAAWWGLSSQMGDEGHSADEVAVARSTDGAASSADGVDVGDASASAVEGGNLSKDGAFLDALERDAGRADLSRDGVAARQAWTEARSLPATAADVLRAYEDEPCATLAMSGYLDIKGDVWGAIVHDTRGWVDMVSCTAGEGDASCDVSVVRLMPKNRGGAGSEGS